MKVSKRCGNEELLSQNWKRWKSREVSIAFGHFCHPRVICLLQRKQIKKSERRFWQTQKAKRTYGPKSIGQLGKRGTKKLQPPSTWNTKGPQARIIKSTWTLKETALRLWSSQTLKLDSCKTKLQVPMGTGEKQIYSLSEGKQCNFDYK